MAVSLFPKIRLSLRQPLGSACQADRSDDLSPQVRPVQNTGRLWEVPRLFGLDPIRSVSYHHALHPFALFSAAHPAPIQAHQEGLLLGLLSR